MQMGFQKKEITPTGEFRKELRMIDLAIQIQPFLNRKNFMEEQNRRDEQMIRDASRRIEKRNRDIRMLDAKIIELSQEVKNVAF